MKDKLSIEYRRRILRWIEQLSKHTYKPVFEIELRGFESEDFWSYDRAKKCETEIYPKHRKWGKPWNYGYFFSEFEIPSECEGRHLIFRPDTGRESLIYINGKAMGAKDKFHFDIPLTKNAKQGDKYEVFIESYAGHGERNGHVGPVSEGTVTVPEPVGKQGRIGLNEVCIWNQEAYLLWIEINSLLDIREKNSHDTLRVHEINKYLKEFTLIVDFESGEEIFMKTVQKCREFIKPAFECTNGTSTPTMYMIGH